MKNHYFALDCLFGIDDPKFDDEFSADLKTLRAGRDFVPGNPLVIEYYNANSFDQKSEKYIRRPNAIIFLNIPTIDNDGKIIATAEWPHKTAKEFTEYLMQTAYCHFVNEHWKQGDFDSKFTSDNDFQVVRFKYVNHISCLGGNTVGVRPETIL